MTYLHAAWPKGIYAKILNESRARALPVHQTECRPRKEMERLLVLQATLVSMALICEHISECGQALGATCNQQSDWDELRIA